MNKDILFEILKFIPNKINLFRQLNKGIKNYIDNSFLKKHAKGFYYYEINNNKILTTSQLLNFDEIYCDFMKDYKWMKLLFNSHKNIKKFDLIYGKEQRNISFKKHSLSTKKIIYQEYISRKQILRIRNKLENYLLIYFNSYDMDIIFDDSYRVSLYSIYNLINYEICYHNISISEIDSSISKRIIILKNGDFFYVDLF